MYRRDKDGIRSSAEKLRRTSHSGGGVKNRAYEVRKASASSEAIKRERRQSLVEANVTATYTALLKRVRGDPDLKDLGENVERARLTQKGEMLYELEEDPSGG